MRDLIVETLNVSKADEVLNRLHSKDSSGLVLIYGEPGNGKTFYSRKRTFTHAWNYYRLRKTETAKSFLQQIYKRLNKTLNGSEEILRGSSIALENACIEMFLRLPDLTFVIDEVNLAVRDHKWSIIEVLRDFKDIADATIVMVGEHDTRDALEGYNPHFFNRCEFIRFRRNQPKDIAKVVKMCSDIHFETDVYEKIIKESAGNLRNASDLIKEFEDQAKRRGLRKLALSDLKGEADE